MPLFAQVVCQMRKVTVGCSNCKTADAMTIGKRHRLDRQGHVRRILAHTRVDQPKTRRLGPAGHPPRVSKNKPEP